MSATGTRCRFGPGRAENPGEQLLHKPFSAEQIAELRKAGQEYRTLSSRRKPPRNKSKKLGDERQMLAAKLKKADAALKAAQQALDADPTVKNKDRYRKAKAEMGLPAKLPRNRRGALQGSTAVTDAANKTVTDLLQSKKAPRPRSADQGPDRRRAQPGARQSELPERPPRRPRHACSRTWMSRARLGWLSCASD